MKDFLILNKLKKSYLPLSFAVIVFILLILLIADAFLIKTIDKDKILPSSLTISTNLKFPILKTEFIPFISANGAVIMDADSKTVLFAKNPALRFSPASTTKIMTALTALEYFKPNDILIVKTATSDGVVLGLKEGEKMTFENLLYALLLPSANDAALAISENYPGGESAFVTKMNENAKKINLFNTHYQDPAGLLDDGDYTTPVDLARLASVAIKNPEFAKIVSTKSKIITDVNRGNVYALENLNKLLGIDGIYGIKTGYTEEAGQVLVISKLENGHTIILIVMSSADRFLDTQRLLDLVSGNISYLSIRQ
ncbi:MAG: D-alanyl-D-alanine carboxypeptidase [Patescibacteria group bacterium]|nr:D-alanyl-D-alanine carboxypeptidase [Patescibacteria group bacterium]